MSLIKALFMGAILTFIVSEVINAGKSKGGWLAIQEVMIQGHEVHWSWPLFIASTGLAWGIMLMMR